MAALRELPELPWYGLGPQWQASRYIGESETWESTEYLDDERVVEEQGYSTGLWHGVGHPDHAPHLPYVNVVSATPDAAESELRWLLDSAIPPEEGPQPEAPHARPGIISIPVDGLPTDFEYLADGPAWVARHVYETHVVRIEARNVEPADITLVRLKDLSGYAPQSWLPAWGPPP